jgi:hypothetical protein
MSHNAIPPLQALEKLWAGSLVNKPSFFFFQFLNLVGYEKYEFGKVRC